MTDEQRTNVRGIHDFDFWMGTWAQKHSRQRHSTPPGCTEFVAFESVSRAWPTLGGMGNVDTLDTEEFPGIGEMHGMSWRILDPKTGRWRIWWAASTRPGVVDEPVEGSFEGPIGTFECDDELGGYRIRVRYGWDATDPDRPIWRQWFSFDGGETWDLNWITENTRIGDAD